jgi:hypothetical protein
MSWDIVLFNSSQKITSPEDVDDTKLIPTNFCSVFETHFKNITQDNDHRSVNGNDFSIDYFCDNEPTSTMILNLYGEPALFHLIDLAIKSDWQIFDTGLGEMIDLGDPTKNGYKNFQTYLNQIISKKD